MKKNSEYTFENSGEFGILVKKFCGFDSYYGKPLYERFVIDVNFDHSKVKIQTFHDKEEWTYCLQRFEGDTIANWYSRERAIDIIGEYGIIEGEKRVRKNIANMKKELKNAKNNPVFLALKPIADNIIHSYKSDFEYHDCLKLYRDNPNKFLWFVRESGTWLIDGKNKDTKGIVEYSTKNEPHHIFWYNGITLKEVYKDEVIDLFNKLPVIE